MGLEDLAPGGAERRLRPCCMPMNDTRSLVVHSHSRLASTDMGPSWPNVSLLMVVSIWKTFTPASAMTLPMRQLLWCSSELWRSMKLLECSMVCTLWWCLIER